MILNGTIRVPPDEFLLEDAKDVWAMMDGLRRTWPSRKWVDELVNEAQTASFTGLF